MNRSPNIYSGKLQKEAEIFITKDGKAGHRLAQELHAVVLGKNLGEILVGVGFLMAHIFRTVSPSSARACTFWLAAIIISYIRQIKRDDDREMRHLISLMKAGETFKLAKPTAVRT